MTEHDRKTCEYIVDWGDGMNRDVSFCGTPATKRYPHCRGFMYLCDEHSIKHLNGQIAKMWCDAEDRALPSRGTEPEDFEEMLRQHAQIAYRNGAAAMNSSKSITDIAPIELALRDYVSRLRHDGEICAKDLSDAWEAIRSLRSQQTGLTAEEAAQLIWKWEGCPNRWDALVYKSAIEKLRDLAALRSLSTGDPRR